MPKWLTLSLSLEGLSLGDRSYTLEGVIADIVFQHTKFLRHYKAQVAINIDPTGKGGILVTVPDLGWDLPVIQCFPRPFMGLSVPGVGDWVEIYFENGDRGKPMYLGKCIEMGTSKPSAYSDQNSHVLFESPLQKESIKFDELQGIFYFGKDAAEAMVLGDKLKTELQKVVDFVTQLQNDFKGWTPVAMDGGAALKAKTVAGFEIKPLPDVSAILSEKEKVK